MTNPLKVLLQIQNGFLQFESTLHTFHTQELNWVQNKSIFLDSIVNLKKIK
jgi:hypothetical protein